MASLGIPSRPLRRPGHARVRVYVYVALVVVFDVRDSDDRDANNYRSDTHRRVTDVTLALLIIIGDQARSN